MWEGGGSRQFIPRTDVSRERLAAMLKHWKVTKRECPEELANLKRRLPLHLLLEFK